MENNDATVRAETAGLATAALMISLIGPVLTAALILYSRLAIVPSVAGVGWESLGNIPFGILAIIFLVVVNFVLGSSAIVFGIKAKKNKRGVIAMCIGFLDVLIPLIFVLWVSITITHNAHLYF